MAGSMINRGGHRVPATPGTQEWPRPWGALRGPREQFVALGSTPWPWGALHSPRTHSTTVFSLSAKTVAALCGKATGKEHKGGHACPAPTVPMTLQIHISHLLPDSKPEYAVIMAHRLSLSFPLENIHAVKRVQECGGPPPTFAVLSFIPLRLSINISLDFTISCHFYFLSL